MNGVVQYVCLIKTISRPFAGRLRGIHICFVYCVVMKYICSIRRNAEHTYTAVYSYGKSSLISDIYTSVLPLTYIRNTCASISSSDISTTSFFLGIRHDCVSPLLSLTSISVRCHSTKVMLV
jgi:hypothetical protein